MTAKNRNVQNTKWVVLGLVFTFCLSFAILSVIPAPPAGFNWDDSWYLFMAEWISDDPGSREFIQTMLQLRQYPPLWPFLIQWTGSGLEHQGSAFLLNGILLALGTGIAMLWFHREGLPTLAVVAGSAMVMLNPVALRWLPTLFSEHLFICLTTLAFFVALNARDRLAWWAMTGLIVGLSIGTRSAGWALAVGFAIHLVHCRYFLRLPTFIAGLALGWLPSWLLSLGLPASPTYSDGLVDSVQGFDLNHLFIQLVGLWNGWRELWVFDAVAITTLLATSAGVALRAHRRAADAWYVIAYICMLLLWPFPEHMGRFLWPLMPAVVLAMHASITQASPPGFQRTAPAALILLFVLSTFPDGLLRTLDRLKYPLPEELQPLARLPAWTRSASPELGMEILRTRAQLLLDVRTIGQMVPASSCVYSELPALVSVHSHRVARSSPWHSLDEIDDYDLLCEYYYLIPSGLPGTDLATVADLRERYTELFHSSAPFEQPEPLPLGVFSRLVRASSEGSSRARERTQQIESE